MTIERVVGTTEEMVDIFVQDATVTTGAGLPNLVISTFSSYYHRTDMTSTSSVTLVSTGTMGTWSSGQWLQINSTFMRGWYQFCAPNGMYANGSSVALHMYGHPSMAPVLMRYDITRQNNQSTVVNAGPVGVSSFNSRVGVSSFDLPVGVSAFGIRVGVSSFGLAVGISSNPIGVDVTSYRNTAAVTTFAGYPAVYFDLGLTNNSSSTVSFPNLTISTSMSSVSVGGSVGVSSISVAVSTGWFSGAGIVTTQAGRLSVDVSSIMGTKIVTTFAGYPATYLDLGLTNNSSSTVSFPNLSISSVPANTGPVGVSSISVAVSTGWFSGAGIVTTLAGRLSVDVSSIMGTKAVTTFAGYFPTHFDLGLTNNTTSTVSFSGVTLSTYPVLDVSTIIAQMSTADISSVRFSVSSVLAPLTVGAVDVTSFRGSPIVTSAAGVLGVHVSTIGARVGVSSFGLPVGVSAFGITVGISSNPIGVRVTTMAIGVGVTTMGIGVGVTTMSVPVDVTSLYSSPLVTTAAGYPAVYLDLGLTNNSSSTVSFPNLSISSGSVSVSVGSVDVSSIYGTAIVTSFPGIPTVNVSTIHGSRLVTTQAGVVAVGAVGVSSFGFAVNISSVAGVPIDGTGTSSDPWGPA